MTPLRIGVLVNRFPVSSETFVLSHVNALYEQGHEVFIFARHASTSESAHESYDPARWAPRTLALSARNGYAASLRRIVQHATALVRQRAELARALAASSAISPALEAVSLAERLAAFRTQPLDILHCHFADQGAFGVSLNRALGVARRVVTTFHGYDINAHYSERAREYARLFQYGDRFTANSQFTSQRAQGLGCPAAKMRIWPMGIAVDRFPFTVRAAPKSAPVRVLTVARLTPKKGIDTALQALARARARLPRFEYHVIGGGSPRARQKLENLAAELRISDCVHWHGPKPDRQVKQFMAEAHLFVLASRTAPNGDMEGQGVVLQEAQACGLPVLSTLHDGIPESVLDGESARLVPENDPDALAEALVRLMNAPETWAAMGAAGRAFVTKKFDASRTNQELASIYAELTRHSLTSSG